MHGATGLPSAITNTRKYINKRTRAATSHAKPRSFPLFTGQAHAEELSQHRG
jgi:hypothetical protein